jgi:cation:H+ antiporter
MDFLPMGPVQDWVSVCLGLVLLLLAGDALVKGAVNLSLRLGIPALVVSLTIVAFGTSAPELLIAIKAVLDDATGIAMGNVVGSNTANVLLVLGVPALMATMHTSECSTRRSFIQMLCATLLFIALCFFGPIVWWHAVILLSFLAFMLGSAFMDAKRHRTVCGAVPDDLEEVEGADPNMPWWRILMFLGLGLVGLPLGADLLVDGSVNIARELGLSETVIGLTLVAIGTSLPELATTVVAALRRQADVALGNVIGSNMFNLLGIIGVAALVGPIEVPETFLSFDLWIMLGATSMLVPFVFLKMDITRTWGAILTGLYAVYLIVVLV